MRTYITRFHAAIVTLILVSFVSVVSGCDNSKLVGGSHPVSAESERASLFYYTPQVITIGGFELRSLPFQITFVVRTGRLVVICECDRNSNIWSGDLWKLYSVAKNTSGNTVLKNVSMRVHVSRITKVRVVSMTANDVKGGIYRLVCYGSGTVRFLGISGGY